MENRARIGLMVPSSNTTVEPEFMSMVPSRLTIHSSRMMIQNATLEGLRKMEKDAENTVSTLCDAKMDIVCYACTSGSFYGGLKRERELSSWLETVAKSPVVTTAQAVINALKAMGSRKIAVATPYVDEINKKLPPFFVENGLEVVNLKGLGIEDNIRIGRQDPNVAYELAKQVNTSEADSIFISCTNLRTIEVVEKLESELCKPVISSNIATCWAALRMLNVNEEIYGYGRLLRDKSIVPS